MMPEILAPPFYLAAGLLVVTGLSKLRHPGPAARAMYAAGIGGSDAAARALGGVELVVGALALLRPAPAVTLALAGMYAAFAAFLAVMKWRRPDAASCGCAGSRDVPPNLVHLSLDVVGAGLGVAAAVGGVPGIATYIGGLGLGALPVLASLAATGVVVAAVATELPQALASYRSAPAHAERVHDRGRHVRADEALATAGIGSGHPSLWPGTAPLEGDE
jgi:hypothetical protein